jgi:hypothetical protein
MAVPNPQTAILGAGLIWLGTLLIPASLWRYFIEERHIDEPSASRSTNWPMVALAIVLAAVGGLPRYGGHLINEYKSLFFLATALRGFDFIWFRRPVK